ncbi:replicative DNA helicase [Arenimonas sp.]|uniref:replicative DNA helicase n=1 Tax=Arenimonas sp. TaxID=1872635 RepID=UPI0035AE8498
MDGNRTGRNHAPEAEQAVLGGLMLDPDALDVIGDSLLEGDFHLHAHRLIYRAIRALSEKRQPFDAVTLGEWLEAKGLAEQIGGPSYLVELASNTPSAANIRAYSEIVRDYSQSRQLADLGARLAHQALEPRDRTPGELAAAFRTEVDRIVQRGPTTWLHAGEAARAAWDELAARYDGATDAGGLSTGIPDLDHYTGGLKPGQLIVIAGRPGSGKSTLGFNIAEHVGLDLRRPTHFHSLEMATEQLGLRLLASRARVSHHALTQAPHRLDDPDWARLTRAVGDVKDCQLWLTGPRELTLPGLLAECRRARSELGATLVIVDYLGLLALRKADRRDLAIGEATRALKLLAGELNAPVVLLSQLNRESDKRQDKRPQLSDLRDSGSIEQDADTVILCHRPQAHDPGSDAPAELIVAKRRDGPTGTAYVRAQLDYCRFEAVSSPAEPTGGATPTRLQSRGRTALERQMGKDT